MPGGPRYSTQLVPWDQVIPAVGLVFTSSLKPDVGLLWIAGAVWT